MGNERPYTHLQQSHQDNPPGLGAGEMVEADENNSLFTIITQSRSFQGGN